MLSVGLFPAIALIAGTVTALVFDDLKPHWALWIALGSAGVAVPAWWVHARRTTIASIAVGFWAAAALLTADAREQALHTPLRAALDREIGGFAIDTLGPEHAHPPLSVRAVLIEDATPRDTYISLRVRAVVIRIRDQWQPVEGGVIVSVSGEASSRRVAEWRDGRLIEAPMTFRRPMRYLDEGVRDFEGELALEGTTLLASVKSGLLVEVVQRGSALDEMASATRALVRSAIERWVAPYDAVSAAIATAMLIGDRGSLPDETRDRLQAAGTYHVIAISGGNIAILAAVITGVLAIGGVRGRRASLPSMAMLTIYALVASSGPSVWRATLMALLYFGARAMDHRVPAWHAAAMAASSMIVVRPLDLCDPGFVLTFGATAALLEGGRRGAALLPRHRALSWLAASVFASLAVEAALLPVSAQLFSRVTSAGLVLNLIAVPLTGVIQIAALTTVLFDRVGSIASAAGWVAHLASSTLVGSAQLVTIAPWLAARVPAPGLAVSVAYYLALVLMLTVRRLRVVAGVAVVGVAIVIGGGIRLADPTPSASLLRLTLFDVGQGESLLLEAPSGQSILIDAGGAPFGGGVDIGQRVLAPALWARGIRSLDTLLVTHGDPDHIGGAAAIVDDFVPGRVWEGIRVPVHPQSIALADQVARQGRRMASLRAGDEMSLGAVRVRVLSPPAPDWERRRVRNDDSVVLEVLYGDVAVLLTGDIGAEVERALIPSLTPARVRVLKVAHHGSRTSTSQELLDAWRPSVALISCGRGNRFGHPATEVVGRLESAGAHVLRTDRDGQITLETDGRIVNVHTYVERHPL
jgi:competence protein ComEC